MCAVVGRNLDHTREFAEQWNIPNSDPSLEDLLSNERVDAVIIASPNKQHYALAMTAIQHGLHILCEKPLAMSYTEAIQMAEAAERAGVKTMVPFTYRFMPASRYLKELIEQGYIGQPYHLNMRYYTGYARDGKYIGGLIWMNMPGMADPDVDEMFRAAVAAQAKAYVPYSTSTSGPRSSPRTRARLRRLQRRERGHGRASPRGRRDLDDGVRR